jgi:hypothetical protein
METSPPAECATLAISMVLAIQYEIRSDGKILCVSAKVCSMIFRTGMPEFISPATFLNNCRRVCVSLTSFCSASSEEVTDSLSFDSGVALSPLALATVAEEVGREIDIRTALLFFIPLLLAGCAYS